MSKAFASVRGRVSERVRDDGGGRVRRFEEAMRGEAEKAGRTGGPGKALGFIGAFRARRQDAGIEALRASDAQIDATVVKVALVILLVDLAWILIGEVNIRKIEISHDVMFAAMGELLVCAAAGLAFAGSRGTKYLLVFSIMANVFMIVAGVDYSMMLLMVLPVVVCSMYYRPAFTVVATAVGGVLMFVGLLINNDLSSIMIGTYYGMTYLDEVVALARVYYVVDVLIYLLVCFVCLYATTRGLYEVRRQAALASEKADFEKEVSAAKGIQQSMLIKDFPFKERFGIASYMSAAKDVGGDFYDCFSVGSDHLAVVIADVSGKGLPAALFMTRSMTVLRSNIQSVSGLDKAMSKANDELASNNGMKYFVTVWAGLIDVGDGSVEYVDAGHNPPFVGRGGRYSKLECRPDFVFGRKKGMKYHVQTTSLGPGDRLFLYTDGVTEAMDPDGGQFGEGRLKESLDSFGGASVDGMLGKLRSDLDAFASGAPQHDDITMMAVELKDVGGRLLVRSGKEGFQEIMGRLAGVLEDAGCGRKTTSEAETICSEILANIDMHAYGGEGGDVRFFAYASDGAIEMEFADWGPPFDPLGHEDPDLAETLETRRRGGLGIMIVKKLSDGIQYSREGDMNVLRIRKEIET